MIENERIANLEAALRLIRQTAANRDNSPSWQRAWIIEAADGALSGKPPSEFAELIQAARGLLYTIENMTSSVMYHAYRGSYAEVGVYDGRDVRW